VAVDPHQPDGALGKGPVKVGGGGKSLALPAGLVPAASGQPDTLGQGFRMDPECLDSLLQAIRAGQIRLHFRETQTHDMHMSIDQTRKHRSPLGIHHWPLGVGRTELIILTQKNNATVLIPGHGLGN
jgi:hypothetical protein